MRVDHSIHDPELEALLRVERPPLTERVPTLGAPAPEMATAVALVTLGYCIAFSIATHLPAGVLAFADWLGLGWGAPRIPVPLAVLGGMMIGVGLATHELHEHLARPAGSDGGPGERTAGLGGRFVYTDDARRRMMRGLAAGYGSAVVLAAALLSTTSASRELLALLAY